MSEPLILSGKDVSQSVYISLLDRISILKDQNTPTEKLIPYLFILLYAFFAFLTTLARELIKDMEDIDGVIKLIRTSTRVMVGKW